MEDEVAAFGLSVIASVGLTSLAVRAGHRFELFDHPVGWKQHARPTPYVGGVAVLLAFLLAGPAVGGELSRLWSLLAIAIALGAVGLSDDARGLPAKLRVLAEMGGATLLWAEGLGWEPFSSDVANLALTNVWVVGLINATNLLDLMDGVAGTVASVASAGVGVLAAIEGDTALAVLAFALAGACAGFLAHNLRSPSRIYLGDCGSMATGFLLAGMIASVPVDGHAGWVVVVGAAPLLGVPLFDIALRIVLRLRRGISLLTGGPDSAANWLHTIVGSARRVAFALGAVQAVLCGLAIGALELGDAPVVALAAALLVAALLVGRTIATSAWAREADARARVTPPEEVGHARGAVVVLGSGLAGAAPITPTARQGGRS